MNKAEGKVVLITGGSRGLGRALAERFGRAGAILVLWARTESDLDQAACELGEAGCEAHWQPVDVTDQAKVEQAAGEVKKKFGPVDVLVNNAGFVKGGPFLEVDIEDHMRTMDINFNAYMRTTMAFLPDMVERDQGYIINISSAAGLGYTPMLASYCASKAAVLNFTDAMRLEMKYLGKRGVKFLVVCPGYMRTGMFEGVKPPVWFPWVDPEKMADKIYRAYEKDKEFLAEPFFAWITPLLRGLMPRKLIDYLQTELGLSQSMDTWKGRDG